MAGRPRRRPAKVPAAHHNRVLQEATEKSLKLEATLVKVLVPFLKKVAADAASQFERHATKSLIASAHEAADRAILCQLGPTASRSLVASLGLVSSVAPNSTMIAVKPTPEQADAIAMAHPDATDPKDLHVTLAYLGKYDGDLRDIADLLAPVAAEHGALEGKTAGVGRFADNGKGAPAIVLPSVPGLVELRVAVTQALVDGNVDYGRDHGYQPHMTILYDKEGMTLPAQDTIGLPLSFNDLLIVRGNTEIVPLPLVGQKPLTAAATKTQADRELQAEQAAQAEMQSAADEIHFAQVALSDAIHAGDEDGIVKATKKLREAQARYARALQSSRSVGKGALGPSPENQPTAAPAATPAAPVNPEAVKQANEAAKKTIEGQSEESKQLARERAAAKTDQAIQDDVKGAETPGDAFAGSTDEILKGAEGLARRQAVEGDLLQGLQMGLGGGNAGWPEPAAGEILNVGALDEAFHEKIDPVTQAAAQNVMSAGVGGSGLNLSFDVTHPLAGKVLAQSASQITGISETTQADVMAIIKEAHDTGLSIPATADLIRSKMAEASPARAALIARTELAGAVNGGSLAAVQIVSGAGGGTYTKQWLTAPGAHYPRHEDYPGLDGQTAALAGTFTVGEDQLQFPGDPNGSPGEVCNCRCTLVYLEGSQEVGEPVSAEEEGGQAPTPPQEPSPAPGPSEAADWSLPDDAPPLIVKEAFPGEEGLPANIRSELAKGRLEPTVVDEAGFMHYYGADFGTEVEQRAAWKKNVYLNSLSDKLPPPANPGQIMALDLWRSPEGDRNLEALLRSGKPVDKIYIDHAGMQEGADLRVGAAQLNTRGLTVTYDSTKDRIVVNAQEMVNGLDRTIEMAPPIEEPMTVYRGMQTDSGLFGKDGPQVGEIVTDPGYQSSTILPEAARNYATPGGSNVKPARGTTGSPTVLEVELPGGQHGFWMSWMTSDDNLEYLLPRGLHYQVDSVTKQGELNYVKVHVVEPGATASQDAKIEAHLDAGKTVPVTSPVTVPTGEGLPENVAAELKQAAEKPQIVDVATAAEQAGIPSVESDIGVTPFVGVRGENPGDNPIGFYDSEKYQQFEKDIVNLAPQYGVTVDGWDRTTGVWEGGSEPSVALHAHDGQVAMHAYAARLGSVYDQDAVVIFDSGADTGGVLATFTKSFKPEEYDDVVQAMADSGLYGGRFTLDGKFEVSGKGTDFVKNVDTLSEKLGVGYDASHGGWELIEKAPEDATGYSYAQATDAFDRARESAGGTGGFAPLPSDSAGPLDGVLHPGAVGAEGAEEAARAVAPALPPLDTITDGPASAYLDQAMAGWGSRLSQPEISALDSWMRVGGHDDIQAYLHGVENKHATMLTNEGEIDSRVKLIDRAIADAPPIDRNLSVTVYRAERDLPRVFGTPDFKVGTVYSDTNFTATTTERDIAEAYARGSAVGHPERSPGLIQVELPAGEQGAWLRAADLESNIPAPWPGGANHELLLARDKQFVITNIGSVNGETVVTVRPLPRGRIEPDVVPLPAPAAAAAVRTDAAIEKVAGLTPNAALTVPPIHIPETPDETANGMMSALARRESATGSPMTDAEMMKGVKNWKTQLDENAVFTPQNAERLQAADAYNRQSDVYADALRKYGPDSVVVIKDTTPVTSILSPGGDFTAAKRMPLNEITVVKERALAELRTGPTAAGDISALVNGGTEAVLRHEYGHQIYASLLPHEKIAFSSSLPDSETIKAQLTHYAAGANPEEAFSELFAVVSDPAYDPRQWAPWVQDLGARYFDSPIADVGDEITLDVGKLLPPEGDNISVPTAPFLSPMAIKDIRRLGLDTNPSEGPVARELFDKLPEGERDTEHLYKNPDGSWKNDRLPVQARIVADHFVGKVPPPPGDRHIYLTAGGGASGKSGAMFIDEHGHEVNFEQLQARPDVIYINPDTVKEMLPEYRAMKNANDPYAASGVHEESSYLSKEILTKAEQGGYSIVYDSTASSTNFTKLLDRFSNDGYDVQVSMMSIPTNEAVMRSLARGARAEGDSAGRYVSVPNLKRAHRGASEQLKTWATDPNVDKWRVYDNTTPPGEPAELVAEGGGGDPPRIYNPAKWQAILAKADEPKVL